MPKPRIELAEPGQEIPEEAKEAAPKRAKRKYTKRSARWNQPQAGFQPQVVVSYFLKNGTNMSVKAMTVQYGEKFWRIFLPGSGPGMTKVLHLAVDQIVAFAIEQPMFAPQSLYQPPSVPEEVQDPPAPVRAPRGPMVHTNPYLDSMRAGTTNMGTPASEVMDPVTGSRRVVNAGFLPG